MTWRQRDKSPFYDHCHIWVRKHLKTINRGCQLKNRESLEAEKWLPSSLCLSFIQFSWRSTGQKEMRKKNERITWVDRIWAITNFDDSWKWAVMKLWAHAKTDSKPREPPINIKCLLIVTHTTTISIIVVINMEGNHPSVLTMWS